MYIVQGLKLLKLNNLKYILASANRQKTNFKYSGRRFQSNASPRKQRIKISINKGYAILCIEKLAYKFYKIRLV